jgi:hypothetical protein
MRVHAATQFLSGFSDPTQHMYLFIGNTLSWPDDSTPPTPIDCQINESSAFRNMMSLKLVDASDVSLVCPRNNWITGTIYTEYVSNVDLFDPSSSLPPFYVITSELNVYKCLNNNDGVPSTVEPTGTTTNVVTSADGYQWKYMFTVNSADVLNFVTTDWIPVNTLTANDGSAQWLVQQAAIPGTIDRIDMTLAGSQYTEIPTIEIVGDGVGATAQATIYGGNVTGITITSTGSGYTWATININGGGVAANGAAATAIISPFNGHGYDSVSELGGFFVIISAQLVYDENSTFTVSNDFRVVGLIKNPLLPNSSPGIATDYNQSTRLTFGTVSGTLFSADEVVTGLTSGATGVVLDWNGTSNVLRLVQVVGTFVPGETVAGANATGVLLNVTGTAVSATTNTIVLPNSCSTVDDFYTGQTILISSGTGNGQVRTISGYVGVSRTATVSQNWSVSPSGTSVFIIASIISPDLEPFTGEILYLENRRPITRAPDQTEDIRIVMEF